jgi:hypothetical protein
MRRNQAVLALADGPTYSQIKFRIFAASEGKGGKHMRFGSAPGSTAHIAGLKLARLWGKAPWFFLSGGCGVRTRNVYDRPELRIGI